MSDCQQILLNASDTAIFMIGLALIEHRQFGEKDISVERIKNAEYISITDGLLQLTQIPEFKDTIPNKVEVSILAIYILNGSDCLSSFYKISSDGILAAFMKYAKYMNPSNGNLVTINNGKFSISPTAFTRLMCCSYLDKHINLFNQFYPNPVALWEATG